MNIAILCFGISTIANPAGTEKVFVERSEEHTSELQSRE